MYFVVLKSANGQYYFVLKSGNHETVATSEMYYAKSSALTTIESIKRGVNIDTQVIDRT